MCALSELPQNLAIRHLPAGLARGVGVFICIQNVTTVKQSERNVLFLIHRFALDNAAPSLHSLSDLASRGEGVNGSVITMQNIIALNEKFLNL